MRRKTERIKKIEGKYRRNRRNNKKTKKQKRIKKEKGTRDNKGISIQWKICTSATSFATILTQTGNEIGNEWP